MAFKVPTLAELRKVTLQATTPISFTVVDEDTGKEETYKTKLIGDCDDTPKGIATLAGKQDKVATLARVEKSKHANGKLVAGKTRPIVQSELEKWLLRYVEATAEGQKVIVNADGSIVPSPEPEPEPEPTKKRKHKERGGIDPALIPEATAVETPTNGEAGNA